MERLAELHACHYAAGRLPPADNMLYEGLRAFLKECAGFANPRQVFLAALADTEECAVWRDVANTCLDGLSQLQAGGDGEVALPALADMEAVATATARLAAALLSNTLLPLADGAPA